METMKLYRAKVPEIAKDVIHLLIQEGDIEVTGDNRPEAEQDLVAIMEEFMRRDFALRERIGDYMAARRIPYTEFGRTKKQMAEEMGHPIGDDIERFLCRQFVENLMISHFVEEVYGEDREMYKKILPILRGHNVDERAIREEAIAKIKNVQEGTIDYEIALQGAIKDVKKRRGLIR